MERTCGDLRWDGVTHWPRVRFVRGDGGWSEWRQRRGRGCDKGCRTCCSLARGASESCPASACLSIESHETNEHARPVLLIHTIAGGAQARATGVGAAVPMFPSQLSGEKIHQNVRVSMLNLQQIEAIPLNAHSGGYTASFQSHFCLPLAYGAWLRPLPFEKFYDTAMLIVIPYFWM